MVFCAGALGCAGALNISFPKSIWFFALFCHSGPKHLYLAMKTSYLHVYLVPTRLLIFRKNSHLHVYLVYTFIQYHGVVLLVVSCQKNHPTTFSKQDWIICQCYQSKRGINFSWFNFFFQDFRVEFFKLFLYQVAMSSLNAR